MVPGARQQPVVVKDEALSIVLQDGLVVRGDLQVVEDEAAIGEGPRGDAPVA